MLMLISTRIFDYTCRYNH